MEKITLQEFLKTNRLKLIVRRSIHGPYHYSCEILNGWIKQNFFYINAYGYGNSESEAINNFLKNICGKILTFNIDNKDKKRTLKVPFILFVKDNEVKDDERTDR